jgi:hypothetical protein
MAGVVHRTCEQVDGQVSACAVTLHRVQPCPTAGAVHRNSEQVDEQVTALLCDAAPRPSPARRQSAAVCSILVGVSTELLSCKCLCRLLLKLVFLSTIA